MSSSFISLLLGSESSSVIGWPSPSRVSIISATLVKELPDAPYNTCNTISTVTELPAVNGPGIVNSAVLTLVKTQPLASFGLNVVPVGR